MLKERIGKSWARQVQFILLAGLLMYPGCAYENEEELFGSLTCDPEEVTYYAVIKPLIQAKCAIPQCHNQNNRNQRNYNIYGIVQAQRKYIKQAIQDYSMPPANAPIGLTREEINKIACWVDNGAPNN